MYGFCWYDIAVGMCLVYEIKGIIEKRREITNAIFANISVIFSKHNTIYPINVTNWSLIYTKKENEETF